MAPEIKGKAIVIMGVCGSGKSTVGNMLAKALNCGFLDADDFHPLANKEKMRQGVPLSDEDRTPWLQHQCDALRESIAGGRTVVLGCSSLRKQYREILRSADPSCKLGSYDSSCSVKFVLLDVKVEVLAERLMKRAAEGTHFMPVSLLQSQLDLLQMDDSEGICKVDATISPRAVVDTILDLDFMKKCT